jgi:Tfp pilus assembly protein PilO
MEDLENIKPLLLKKRHVIMPALTVLAVLAVIVLVVAPQVLGYFATGEEIASKSNRVTSLEVKAAELENLNSLEFQEGLQVVSTVLPPDSDIPGAVAELQDLVRSSGLELVGISYVPLDKNAKSFQLSVNVSGSLLQIRSLLIALQSAPRIYQVQTITLRQVETKTEASIPITVFFGGVSPKSPGADAPLALLTDEERELLNRIRTNLNVTPVSSQSNNSTSSAQSVPVDPANIPLGKPDPFN